MLVVSLSGLTYNTTRNIVSLPVDVQYKKTYDLFAIFRKLTYRLGYSTDNLAYYFYWDADLNRLFNKTRLFHFFNTVSFGTTPWITTFETVAPRMANYRMLSATTRIGMRLVAGDSCKRLLAISDNAKNLQLRVTGELHPHLYDAIESKLIVMHPAQRMLVSQFDEKPKLERPTFTFVGADFFRKGGKEVLAVFDRLIERGFDLVLNIVSSLQFGDYASKTTEEDRKQALRLIQKHPNSIRHVDSLKNDDVLRLLVNSHVALLPSYADTYGYSVLEAQAAGCPVITTDIRAMTEINSDACGWLLRVPQTDMKFGVIYTPADRRAFSRALEEQLEAAIIEIARNPDKVAVKGKAALDRIRKFHDPAVTATKMMDVYKQALAV